MNPRCFAGEIVDQVIAQIIGLYSMIHIFVSSHIKFASIKRNEITVVLFSLLLCYDAKMPTH